jgi:DNA-binding NarL/FixJ family response regulator
VIVLSTDRALIDLLRDSLAGAHRVWRADDVAHAEQLIIAASNPVFLVDASLAGGDTRALVNRVHQQFPDLAIIVAGRRDDEALFAPIVSSGVIFRCLPNPASAERIRGLVDAAQRRPRRKTDPPATAAGMALSAAITGTRLAIKLAKSALPKIALPKITLPKFRVDRAWVRRWSRRCQMLVALLLTVWVLSLWKPWNDAAGLFSGQEPAPAAPVEISSEAKSQQLLNDAGIALTQDRLVDPPGQNALELYRAALALDPDNDLARRGIDNVADKLLAEAERALQAHDMLRLASAVDAARSARPDHPRVEYYSQQLKLERERMFAPGRIRAQ